MRRILLSASIIMVLAAYVLFGVSLIKDNDYVAREASNGEAYSDWNALLSNYVNSEGVSLSIDGIKQSVTITRNVYMDEDMNPVFTQAAVRDAFDCAVDFYDDERLILAKGNTSAEIYVGDNFIKVNDDIYEIEHPLRMVAGDLYIPAEVITKGLGYDYSWNRKDMTAAFKSENPDITGIPYYYNHAERGRMTDVKDQGEFGTCWAFAAVSALESTLLPAERWDFSEDHLIYNNGFGDKSGSGGDYILALAYFSSWRGPVLEEDDPYGDGITDATLAAVKHVQEVQLIQGKDYGTIKKMVFKYGAVASGLYISTQDEKYIDTTYYNVENAAYCYPMEAAPNHEIVIIGWDDDYPKENFNGDIPEDGAFICKNSWGEGFGDNGIFYVSYCDGVIGESCEVYTRVDDNDNYDNIYQLDDSGWSGRIGYDRNKAYFANVYKSERSENLMAVGFYATGPDTTYNVYVCRNFEGTESLKTDKAYLYASGTFKNPGYYTVDLNEAVEIQGGDEFAVIVEINTPGVGRPIAIEVATEERENTVDTYGKKSYISSYGYDWELTQQSSKCNVILKVFTNDR